jgi:hypothetical protein
MATPLIGGKPAPTEAQLQPPLRIINTPPAAGQSVTLEQAAANSKKAVDAAK